MFGKGLKYFNLSEKFEEEEEEDEDEIVVNKKPKADINADGKISAADKWVSIIRQLMVFGYLEKDIDNYGVVKISEKGQKYLQDPYIITFSEDHDLNETEGSGEDELQQTAGPSLGGGASDQALLELLKALRKKIAKEKILVTTNSFKKCKGRLLKILKLLPQTSKTSIIPIQKIVYLIIVQKLNLHKL
jgi:ATP-dependent DNA helicase RecQ